MSILPAALDPYAAGDFDSRCYRCNHANLDNPTTPADTPCPIERYGRTPCAACCIQLWVDGDETGAYCTDCHATMSVPPTWTKVGVGTTPSNHTLASSDSVPAPTTPLPPLVECDNCDECGALQPAYHFMQVMGYGLMCPRCVDELRDTGLAS
jgi:hypothetical protein